MARFPLGVAPRFARRINLLRGDDDVCLIHHRLKGKRAARGRLRVF